MKKIFFFLALAWSMSLSTLDAQSPNRPNSIYAKKLWVDHYTPPMGELTGFKNITDGFELDYLRNLNPYLNAVIPLKVGVFNVPEDVDNHTFMGLDFVVQGQLYKEEKTIIPYAFAGLGSTITDFNSVDFQIPMGLGINIRVGKAIVINAQAEYRMELSSNTDNIHYGLGIGFMLGKDEPEEVIPPDTDGDGISDREDECPQDPGTAEFKGCPDSDGDGIIDKEDKCPTEEGPKSNDGCPILDIDGDGFLNDVDECPNTPGTIAGCPDTDGDGIMDSEDDCPNAAGEARFNGCPDSDGDGIIDIDDKCPDSPAPHSSDGCPFIKTEDKAVLDYALQAIQFETGKTVLKKESYPVLDQVIEVLQRYPDYRLEIIGHTDDVGRENNNLILSQKRAKSCYEYLISKGLSNERVGYGGSGEANPLVPNDSKDNRTINRRVEFLLTPL